MFKHYKLHLNVLYSYSALNNTNTQHPRPKCRCLDQVVPSGSGRATLLGERDWETGSLGLRNRAL